MWIVKKNGKKLEGSRVYAADGAYLGAVYGGRLYESSDAAAHAEDLKAAGLVEEHPAEGEVDGVPNDG